jgi:hypothetical protein
MLDPYAAVVIFEEGNGQPAYCTVAHNLSQWDAERLAKRLVEQYDQDAHVVLHLVQHNDRDAIECEACMLLFEEIIERAVKLHGQSQTTLSIPDATGNSQ